MAGTLPGFATFALARRSPWLRPAAYALLVMLLAMQCGPASGQGMGGGGMGGGGMGGGGMGGGGMGGGGMGGGGQGGGGMGGGGMTAAGIVIDANGVLRTQTVAGAGLSAERLKAALASLPADLQAKSPLRKVALSRLEAEVAKASAADIVNGMRESLGPQRIRIDGVSPASHFAQVMVEADYRMKLIGIGLERPPVKMNSWIELTSAGGVAANALQRWYFMPDYQCIRASEDDLAIELVGRGVKLVGADEAVLPDGRRMTADRTDRASKTFTETFTRKYAEIAARNPVYAQLRTLIDLAVLAAYLQEHDGYGRTHWAAAALRDEQICAIERFQSPTVVEPAINAVWRGSRLLTPIGGGVTLQPRIALDSPNLLMDEKGTVAAARGDKLAVPAGRWWWD